MNAFVKTIVDEIGLWVKQYVSTHGGGQDSRVDGIVAKIPSAASADNQLADKAYVNDVAQSASANFRGSWDNYGSLPSNSEQYPADYAGETTPKTNDYAVIESANGVATFSKQFILTSRTYNGGWFLTIDGVQTLYAVTSEITLTDTCKISLYRSGSRTNNAKVVSGSIKVGEQIYSEGDIFLSTDYSGSVTKTCYMSQGLHGRWRMKYSGVWVTNGKSGWLPEYQVNEEPMTADQVAALNSGITAAKVAQIGAVAPLVKEVVAGNVATKYIDANKLYVFSERSADLAIDVTDEDNTLGIYVYQIEFGENVYGLDHPSVIAKWDGGSAPTPAANKTYEVSIMNGIAFWREV